MTSLLVFGYTPNGDSPTDRDRMNQFSMLVGKLAGTDVVISEGASYDDLAHAMHGRAIDFAWLPPIPYIALERVDACVAVVSNHRDGSAPYQSVLIVEAGATIARLTDLVGKRAAWVDPRSASGYVIPRIALPGQGVDPRTAFVTERFYRTHEAVVYAVVEGRADFGATYAGLDASGAVVRGPWLDLPGVDERVRVVAAFGSIPGDVIAVRSDVAEATRDKLARAFIAASHDPANRLLIREVFGVDEFRRFAPSGYDALRRATMEATEAGLIDGLEKGEPGPDDTQERSASS